MMRFPCARVFTIVLPAIQMLAVNALGEVYSVPGDYDTIQEAIVACDSSGDEIIVGPGTYFEAIDFLGKAIYLHSSDGPDVTTIDALGGGTVVRCVSGEGADTILEGFTISGGNADYGGGMYNESASPTVTNCEFSGNTATEGGGGMSNYSGANPTVTDCTFIGNSGEYRGGGMYNWNSSPTVADCEFSGNTANAINEGLGGGMHNENANPTVTNCTFRGNACTGVGGGMYNWNSSPTVTHCRFIGNYGDDGGGGMLNEEGSSPAVTNCRFTGNIGSEGGGMYNFLASPTVTNCTFIENKVVYGGGGIRNFASSPVVTNCSFTGNNATSGGGIWNYSSVAASAPGVVSSPTLTTCILWGNPGGEIYNSFGYTTVTHSNIQGGYPGAGNIDADPLFVVAGSDDLINCCSAQTPWGCGDCDSAHPGIPGCSHRGCEALICQLMPYCCELEWYSICAYEAHNRCGCDGGGGAGGGCDDAECEALVCAADPYCCDAEWDSFCADAAASVCGDLCPATDLRLLPGSPCIDAGDNAAVPADELDLDGDGDTDEPVPYDLDGESRFVDDPDADDCPQAPGTCGAAPVVDMGAYESQVIEACPADVTGDGAVDAADLGALLGSWGPCADCPADVNGDGGVDAADLGALLGSWGTCP